MSENQAELLSYPNPEPSPAEDAERAEYRRRLAEYLKDPAFRAIEGFPLGSDEAILALSDSPYYTACPNPFLPEILERWKQEREETRRKLGLVQDEYQREPFAADVSEGKNDPIYNAHSYHTKVPHKAIMRYILHYTDPGDLVFDGFCGSGMTGVAAQLCGDRKTVESLGYRVDEQGGIWEGEKRISTLGVRKAVLNDLSPAATFIAYNYNTPVDAAAFEREAKRILREVEEECGWMYATWHPRCDAPGRVQGRINYTVWSDVFICPNCGRELVFWDVAVDPQERTIRDAWVCPGCGTRLAKSPKKGSGALKAERAWETHFDRELRRSVRQAKQVPVLINYSVGKRRFEKRPDEADLELIQTIEEQDIPYPVPTEPLPKGDKTGDPLNVGITHVHQLYSRRNLWTLSSIANRSRRVGGIRFFWLTASLLRTSELYKFTLDRKMGTVSGTLYVPSLWTENTSIKLLNEKLSIASAFGKQQAGTAVVATGSSTSVSGLPDDSLDYLFVDPPFGGNLMYSELNFLWEAWLRVFTNNQEEAVINRAQHKGLLEYQRLMQACFEEFHRVLKPGRWMTVEFHNSQNAVWNAIQEALQRAGFVVADVRLLDKREGSFNQVTAAAAVKQDLVISAYKPNGNLEERFGLEAGTEEGAWEFVRYHLGKLPVVNRAGERIAVNPERQAFRLYDRMVAFHVRHGVLVPLSSAEFYAGLDRHFLRRDGMYFLPEQVVEYDRAVLNSGAPAQLSFFVNDEKTAIAWLRQQLDPGAGGEPKTQGELTNDFNRVMNRAKHEQPLELIDILEQNFVRDEQGRWHVPDPNKASDLEKLRQRALLKEFKEYTQSTGRLRVFRAEAVRAGFADCLSRKDFDTILRVGERLPEDALREDPELLMYYDSALLRKK